MAIIVPGWNPSPFKGTLAAVALSSISNPTSASSTTVNIAWPTVLAGDMAIVFDVVSGYGGLPTAVTPSGFTKMCDANDGSLSRGILSFKRCDGTESGNLATMVIPQFSGGKKAMVVLRGDIPLASISGFDGEAGAFNANDPGAITVNASGGTPPLLVIGAYWASSGTVDPRTFSTTKDGEVSFHTNSFYIAWKLYLSSPADTSIDMADEGSGNLIQGFYAQVTV